MPGTSVMAFKGPGVCAHDAETLTSVKTAAPQAELATPRSRLASGVFIGSTFVATTAVVVFLRRPPGTAAGLDMPGVGPLWIGMRLPNSPASSSAAAYRLPLASKVEPTEFTATMAPTMTPLSRTTLAVPSPPFTPPETAPAPAPTLPSCTGPDRAALHAERPKEKFGR